MRTAEVQPLDFGGAGNCAQNRRQLSADVQRLQTPHFRGLRFDVLMEEVPEMEASVPSIRPYLAVFRDPTPKLFGKPAKTTMFRRGKGSKMSGKRLWAILVSWIQSAIASQEDAVSNSRSCRRLSQILSISISLALLELG